MPQAFPAEPAVVRFAPFDLDLRTGELWRDGARTTLQDHPFEILRCLLEHPGELVTRDELRARLWPNGTIVDFEHGLNTAVKRLREALGDDAEHPQFVETVRRRGYRFVADVQAGVPPRPPVPVENAGRVAPGGVKHALRTVPIGEYRLIEQIGAGAMGRVFLAEDRLLRRRVALKFLPPGVENDRAWLARFQREAEALASVSHPNIAAIHGLAEADAQRCLVLEYVDGESLESRIRRGPLPVAEAVAVCSQIADALESAHGRGIIPRDLNPGNIKITADGRVKLLDFGIAKALAGPPGPGMSEGVRELSHPGVVLGTARYMSPEQAAGRPVDQRTDIWALGCVLFACLAGRPPFPGDTAPAILAAIASREPEWSRLPSELPQPLRTLLERCLRKDPARRLHDAADARIELTDALAMPATRRSPPTADWRALARRLGLLGAALLLIGVLAGTLASRACG